MIKHNIEDHQKMVSDELDSLDNFLEDLPSDIKDIKELNDVIGNNKDMNRAYDLGRQEAFLEFKSMLTEIRKNC
jgi:hypothetical protein